MTISPSRIVNVTILERGGSTTPIELTVDSTLSDLRRLYKPSIDVYRKNFKLAPDNGAPEITLKGDSTLSSQGVKDGCSLTFKLLPPQIGYRTVFVVEYLGPILIMLFYAMQPSFIYPRPAEGAPAHPPFTKIQSLYIVMFLLHFLKREYETFFVHKFSRPTMPLTNLFKNSAYYWGFATVIGYFLCSPSFKDVLTFGQAQIFTGMWCLCQLGNFAVHYQLSNSRKSDGDTTRRPPTGGLFTLVSCPNYTFEVLGWVMFSAGSGLVSSFLFTLIGFAQMTQWALQKHRDYVAQDSSLRSRKSILPFII